MVIEEFNVLKEMHNFLLRIVSTDKNEDKKDSIHEELKSISSEYIEMKKPQNHKTIKNPYLYEVFIHTHT